jgi:chemotaxis protein CheY-P-specific phosphatase CheC
MAELFSADELDLFGEVVNVAMGQAGAALAEAYAGFVQLQVPQIGIFEATAIVQRRGELLHQYASDATVSAVRQEFFGELAGEVLLVLGAPSFPVLGEMLGFDDRVGNDGSGRKQREELLLDLDNALASTCILAIGRQLGLLTGLQPPRLLALEATAADADERLCEAQPAEAGSTLLIEMVFRLKDQATPFGLVIAIAPAALPGIHDALAKRL